MVVQKAMGLALSGAEKTSGIALRRRTRIYAGGALNMAIEQASRIMDATESKARGSSDPGNGVGHPGARRAAVGQDRRSCLVEGCPRVIQGGRMFLEARAAIQGKRGFLDAGKRRGSVENRIEVGR
jgi:hypothetical protein